MATITLNGNEYTLATNLRVAYLVQGQHNHKPYVAIFSELNELGIEEQIDLLYASFQVGNPEDAKTFTREMFRRYILDSDEFTVSKLLNLIQEVIAGILGKDFTDIDDSDTQEVDGKAKN